MKKAFSYVIALYIIAFILVLVFNEKKFFIIFFIIAQFLFSFFVIFFIAAFLLKKFKKAISPNSDSNELSSSMVIKEEEGPIKPLGSINSSKANFIKFVSYNFLIGTFALIVVLYLERKKIPFEEFPIIIFIYFLLIVASLIFWERLSVKEIIMYENGYQANYFYINKNFFFDFEQAFEIIAPFSFFRKKIIFIDKKGNKYEISNESFNKKDFELFIKYVAIQAKKKNIKIAGKLL